MNIRKLPLLLTNEIQKIKFVNRIFLSNLRLNPFPYKLTFAITYRCNLKCKTCLIWSKEGREELNLKEIEVFFKKSNSFSWVDLTGGEIFMRPDLPDIIDAVLGNCRSLSVLHFPTNGLLTEKIITAADKIHKRNRVVLVITVSIDGPEKIHNKIRGSEDSWNAAVNTFVGLKGLGIRHAYIGYTISRHNMGEAAKLYLEIKKIYPKLKYDDIHINFFHASPHYLNNAGLEPPSEHEIIKEIREIQLKKRKKLIKTMLEEKYFRMAPQYLRFKKMPVRCQALGASVFIDPCGDIYPCSIYARKIANIRDINYDIGKLWNSSGMTAGVRKEIVNNKCGGCWTPCEAYPAILGSIFV